MLSVSNACSRRVIIPPFHRSRHRPRHRHHFQPYRCRHRHRRPCRYEGHSLPTSVVKRITLVNLKNIKNFYASATGTEGGCGGADGGSMCAAYMKNGLIVAFAL